MVSAMAAIQTDNWHCYSKAGLSFIANSAIIFLLTLWREEKNSKLVRSAGRGGNDSTNISQCETSSTELDSSGLGSQSAPLVSVGITLYAESTFLFLFSASS